MTNNLGGPPPFLGSWGGGLGGSSTGGVGVDSAYSDARRDAINAALANEKTKEQTLKDQASSGTSSSNPSRVIVTEDGKFTIGGKSYDLMGLLFTVFKEAGLRAKQRLAISIQDLKDANNDAKMATDWLNLVRAQRPSGDANSTISAGDFTTKAVNAFKARHPGIDPFIQCNLVGMKQGGEYKQSQIDQIIEGTKSYMSTINSNQQMIQLDTQRFTHMVDETNEAMSSVEKSISQAIQSVISKI